MVAVLVAHIKLFAVIILCWGLYTVDAVLYLYPRAHVHLTDPAELQKIMQLVKGGIL